MGALKGSMNEAKVKEYEKGEVIIFSCDFWGWKTAGVNVVGLLWKKS